MSENINASVISISGNFTTNTNVNDALHELFGSYNEPNSLLSLNGDGTFDSVLRPPSSITGYLSSEQSQDKSEIDANIKRIDKYIEQMKATQIVYSNNNYLLQDDVSRPSNKLSYIEYGEGINSPIISLAYSNEGKLIRVDYYLDRSTFNIDGSGRDGFNSISYNNLGKLQSSIFTEL